MKAYFLITGSIFGLLALLHLNRLFMDGGHAFAADPSSAWGNVVAVLVSGGFAGWAGWLFGTRRVPKGPGGQP
jgi:hypothetical protein